MQTITSTESTDSILASLESRIEGWQKELQASLLQVGALELSIHYAKAEHGKIINTRSSISRLPNEILVLIFKAGQAHASGASIRFEVLVSHVTSHWRNVAINAPSLWTFIPAHLYIGSLQLTDIAAVYTERSKSCPLDIRFADRMTSSNPSFGALTTHVHRWRRFSVITHHPAVISELCMHLQAAPLLERLSLRLESNFGDTATSVHVVLPPPLSFLRLWGSAIDFRLSSPSNLKTLVLERVGISDGYLSTLFTMLPCLTHLSLSQLNYVTDGPHNFPTIEIPTLRSLTISTLILLPAFVAPQLESLRHNGWIYQDRTVEDWIQFTSMTTKFPILRSLSLNICGSSKFQSRRVFDTFLTVEHLTLRMRGDDNAISVLRECSLAVWPKLRTITIVEFRPGHCNMLCAALQSRKESGFPISKLYLPDSFQRWPEGQTHLRQLREVVEVEIDLHMTYDNPELWEPVRQKFCREVM